MYRSTDDLTNWIGYIDSYEIPISWVMDDQKSSYSELGLRFHRYGEIPEGEAYEAEEVRKRFFLPS